MKTHLNTLYITTQGAYLAASGQCILVRAQGKTLARFPLHHLESVVCFGRVGASPALMGLCADRGIALNWLTINGRFLASVHGYAPGNVLLRRAQYRLADAPEVAIDVSRRIVLAKVANSRAVMLRAARDADPEHEPSLRSAGGRLAASLVEVRHADHLDVLRGLEGEAATHYFGAFNHLLSSQADHSAFHFSKRSRRPPLDPINALLSFLYTLLLNDIRSACAAAGLDAAVGFLHTDRPGKPSLALDMLEEFRAFLADRLAFSLINRRQIDAEGFQTRETGAVEMNDATRKQLLVAYQKRKQESLTHPYLEEECSIGLLPHLQARLMARWMRGDLDAYPPFLWKG